MGRYLEWGVQLTLDVNVEKPHLELESHLCYLECHHSLWGWVVGCCPIQRFHYIANSPSSCCFLYSSTRFQWVRSTRTLVLEDCKWASDPLLCSSKITYVFTALSAWSAGYTFTRDILEQAGLSHLHHRHLCIWWHGLVARYPPPRRALEPSLLFHPRVQAQDEVPYGDFPFYIHNIIKCAVLCYVLGWSTASEADIIPF